MPHGIESHSPAATPVAAQRPDVVAVLAFIAATLFAGGNAVAIRLGYAELAPFWSAGARFAAAALILLAVAAAMRLVLPRGRALVGALIFGALNFALNYTFVYYALTEVTAGTAMVVLAIVPLLTVFLAAIQKTEPFRLQGLIGSVLAAIGILFVFQASIGLASLGALLALVAAAVCIAESNIVIKIFPRVNPVMETAIGMAMGGGWLLLVSYALSEPWVVPSDPKVQLSLGYLVVLGSIGLFVLYLIVLTRWTATGASYGLLISPLVAIVLGFLLLGEPVRADFFIGGLLVLAGVYIGAFANAGARHVR